MKISTKGRYALRIMLDLALSDTGKPVRVKDIARRQEISEKYMEQIISVLNKAGFVRSIRGPQGGYFLARKPSEYTAGMILRLTEGSMVPVDCLEFEKPGCTRQSDCATFLLWKRLDEALRGVIDTVTLEDLVDWSRKGGHDYSI
ncbi:MAG: Rrf2 family transcriptional regulator [Lachnospiraceae bacterium]|nr:Rrf2 family transcriptional regulator [Lachnospiraceae bacterium]